MVDTSNLTFLKIIAVTFIGLYFLSWLYFSGHPQPDGIYMTPEIYAKMYPESMLIFFGVVTAAAFGVEGVITKLKNRSSNQNIPLVGVFGDRPLSQLSSRLQLQLLQKNDNGQKARENTLQELNASIDFLKKQIIYFENEKTTIANDTRYVNKNDQQVELENIQIRITEAQDQLKRAENYKKEVMSWETWEN